MRTSYAGENAWEDEDTAIISKDESSNGDVAGSVVLKKKDAVRQATLAGAEFKLVNKDTGEVVNTGLVTDQQGQIKLQDLAVGNYEFIQTKADYTGFKVRFWLQVSKNGTCKITKYEVFK